MPQVILEAQNPVPLFTLNDQEGGSVALSDYLGKKVIVYFYPAAGTPGCTTQACDFRDNMASLVAEGYVVLGISKDGPSALKQFAQEERLDFPLLSDPDLAVHHLFGAFGEKLMYGKTVNGVIRSTFVVDEEGVLQHALYNVKATGHVAALKKKLGMSAS